MGNFNGNGLEISDCQVTSGKLLNYTCMQFHIWQSDSIVHVDNVQNNATSPPWSNLGKIHAAD